MFTRFNSSPEHNGLTIHASCVCTGFISRVQLVRLCLHYSMKNQSKWIFSDKFDFSIPGWVGWLVFKHNTGLLTMNCAPKLRKPLEYKMARCFIQDHDENKIQEKKHLLNRKTRGWPYDVSLNKRIKTDINYVQWKCIIKQTVNEHLGLSMFCTGKISHRVLLKSASSDGEHRGCGNFITGNSRPVHTKMVVTIAKERMEAP